MDDRLHRALDGELGPDGLPPHLALDFEETRDLLDGVVRAIPARPIPDLGAAVLRRIDAAAPSPSVALHRSENRPRRRGGFAAWLWAPRRMSIAIRPAYALAAAAVIAAAVGVGARSIGRTVASPATGQAAEVLVHFKLEAPQAHTVSLAGDFSNWSPEYAMKRSAEGAWTIVVPLTPGVHEYAFVVDGQRWVPDPAAPSKPDGFGGLNSRIAVLRPDVRS